MKSWCSGPRRFGALFPALLLSLPAALGAQQVIAPEHAGGVVHLFPSDLAVLEAGQPRDDLPCHVTEAKPTLGFDLRFHVGYRATVSFAALAGNGGELTVLFRVYPEGEKQRAKYFVQHFHVPPIQNDAKGDASLDGGVDVGEGSYHVDWLMRDRAEEVCSSSWETEAKLDDNESMPLFLARNEIRESLPGPFASEAPHDRRNKNGPLHLKLLVNFAPQIENAATLQQSDTSALVSILREIEDDPRVGRVSLVAFDLPQSRVVYRQHSATHIDFPALGQALQTVKLGTVSVTDLAQKHSETDFLENLIERQVAGPNPPDAIVFAGPKAMLQANVPKDALRRIGTIRCPVFYMNYNLYPRAIPWKDAISHAISVFKGTEYTISTPRQLWSATSDMLNRVMRLKRERAGAQTMSRVDSEGEPRASDPPFPQSR